MALVVRIKDFGKIRGGILNLQIIWRFFWGFCVIFWFFGVLGGLGVLGGEGVRPRMARFFLEYSEGVEQGSGLPCCICEEVEISKA